MKLSAFLRDRLDEAETHYRTQYEFDDPRAKPCPVCRRSIFRYQFTPGEFYVQLGHYGTTTCACTIDEWKVLTNARLSAQATFMLKDIAAKQVIVRRYEQVHADYHRYRDAIVFRDWVNLTVVVAEMAKPYADHAAYEPEWHPTAVIDHVNALIAARAAIVA